MIDEETEVITKRGHVPLTLLIALFASAIAITHSHNLSFPSPEIKRKPQRIGEWIVSRNRYTHVKRRREDAFMSGLTDLPLLFHFSPYTNRNRIGQRTCTCSIGCTEVYFLCGILSFLSNRRIRQCRMLCKNHPARCKT